MPRELQCHAAFLAIHKDKEDIVLYSMLWAGMYDEENEVWQLHFSADSEGLYFYHFEIETIVGRQYIENAGFGIGQIANDKEDFQQTVYKENFVTPKTLQGGIIYQIFPDRFKNSGTPKTNVPTTRIMRKWGEEPFWDESQMNGIWNNDYFGGDLKGIEEKLDYLEDLGVSAIYLNPIFEANSNHRYDTANYEKIDSLLGNEEDFISLCERAKEHGILIILDGVFSHTGCDSKYFNLYSHYDTIGAANSKDSPYYSWYKFNKFPNDYESWWGIKLLPDVDETNESYLQYICGENGIIKKWLRLGASGWRLDVADELPDKFLDALREAVKAEKEDAVIIGEVWEDASNKVSYSQRRRYLLGDQLDSVMNYPFSNAILDFISNGGADIFFDKIMTIIENYPKCCLDILMNHIGTHDTERVLNCLAGFSSDGKDRKWQHDHDKLTAEQYKRATEKLKLASLIQYTLPGVPSIYYADETGMTGMDDPFNRKCFDWDNIDEDLLNWYKNLGKIRRMSSAFMDGEFEIVYSTDDTIAYSRISENSAVLIALNNSKEPSISLIELPQIFKNSTCILGIDHVGKNLSLCNGEYSILSVNI